MVEGYLLERKMSKKENNDLISKSKDILNQLKNKNNVDIQDIIETIEETEETSLSQHVPIHTLKEIKSKLGKQVAVKDDDGNEMMKPLYTEEEKVKVIFGLLSERGINMLDYLDEVLKETGFHPSIIEQINETMGKTTELLRDISDIQYKRAKLENERSYLEIQKYKADLKKREIELKENKADLSKGNTNNIIAVGSMDELMNLMGGKKEVDDAHVIEESKEEE
jgi:hypothetical protein